MTIRHAIVRRDNTSIIHEVIPHNTVVVPTSPIFYSGGNPFEYKDFTVREMTEDEIKSYFTLSESDNTTSRRSNEYEQWLVTNDEMESNGVESFNLNGVKFYTINREEFKLLAEKAEKESKFTVDYRGRKFSVYHYS
jgi:hypothetical protein